MKERYIRIEPLVREALGAAVKQDEDRFGDALMAMSEHEERDRGVELAILISKMALLDACDGKFPSPPEVEDGALSISEMEPWLPVTREQAKGFLMTVIHDEPLVETVKPIEYMIPVAFAVTANLLSGSPKKREGEWWFNYLDRIEIAIAELGEQAGQPPA